MTNNTSGSKERASLTDSWWGKVIAGLFLGGVTFYGASAGTPPTQGWWMKAAIKGLD
jgi:hypothetical protein